MNHESFDGCCRNCGRPLSRKAKESQVKFKTRLYCHQTCLMAHQRAKAEAVIAMKRDVTASKLAVTQPARKQTPKPLRLREPSDIDWVKRLDAATQTLLFEAVDQHPDFLMAFSNVRAFDYVDELRASDFLRTT